MTGPPYRPDPDLIGQAEKAMTGGQPLWSILIATHASRVDRFVPLVTELCHQAGDWDHVTAPGTPPVEVVALFNDGTEHLGAYRQRLLDTALGEYVSYVDDDDWVDRSFVGLCAWTLYSLAPDIVSFDVEYTEQGEPGEWDRCVLDIDAGWHETGDTMYRDLTVVQPLKAEIARDGRWDTGQWPEDRSWRAQILDQRRAWKQARLTDRPLYFYRHSWADSAQRRGGLGVASPCPSRPVLAGTGFRWFRWAG